MCGDVIFELTQSIDALSWAEILYPFVFLVTFFPSSVLYAHGKIELQLESTRWQNPTGTVADLGANSSRRSNRFDCSNFVTN
jgi:hypothetical protein